MTIGAISRILGISKSTVHRYVKALEERGLIVRGPDGYPDVTLSLVRRLYSLVKEVGSLQEALDALSQGIEPGREMSCESLKEEIERLRTFLEGFASTVLKRLDELERRLESLEGPKGLPSPEHGKRKPWWRRFFGGGSS